MTYFFNCLCVLSVQPLSYQAQALGGVKKGTESSGIKGMPDGKNTSLSAMELSSILVAVSLLVVLVQLYSADLRSPSQVRGGGRGITC
jgi:hypothetical protein